MTLEIGAIITLACVVAGLAYALVWANKQRAVDEAVRRAVGDQDQRTQGQATPPPVVFSAVLSDARPPVVAPGQADARSAIGLTDSGLREGERAYEITVDHRGVVLVWKLKQKGSPPDFTLSRELVASFGRYQWAFFSDLEERWDLLQRDKEGEPFVQKVNGARVVA